MPEDYYTTLGVHRNASHEEIHRAYRDLARKYHPDLNPDDPQAEKKFEEVQAAFEVLSDPEKRAGHDGCIARAFAKVRRVPENLGDSENGIKEAERVFNAVREDSRNRRSDAVYGSSDYVPLMIFATILWLFLTSPCTLTVGYSFLVSINALDSAHEQGDTVHSSFEQLKESSEQSRERDSIELLLGLFFSGVTLLYGIVMFALACEHCNR